MFFISFISGGAGFRLTEHQRTEGPYDGPGQVGELSQVFGETVDGEGRHHQVQQGSYADDHEDHDGDQIDHLLLVLGEAGIEHGSQGHTHSSINDIGGNVGQEHQVSGSSGINVDLGIKESFTASCAVFRHGDPGMHNEGYVIQNGDILHCDIGVDYLGLCTDTQQLAYILKPGETEAPEGLRNAMKIGNRLQDIVISTFALGKTGNEALKECRQMAIEEGIVPCVYCHPVGVFAHAPGPSVGQFSNQEYTTHGQLEFHKDTNYALELNATVVIPEWDNETLMTCLETNIYFDGEKVHYMAERQTELILIR